MNRANMDREIAGSPLQPRTSGGCHAEGISKKIEYHLLDFHGINRCYDLDRRVTVMPVPELAATGVATVLAGLGSPKRLR